MSNQPQQKFIELSREVHDVFGKMHGLLSGENKVSAVVLAEELNELMMKIQAYREGLKQAVIPQGMTQRLNEQCHQMMLETMSLFRKNEKALLSLNQPYMQQVKPVQSSAPQAMPKNRISYITS